MKGQTYMYYTEVWFETQENVMAWDPALGYNSYIVQAGITGRCSVK